MLGCLLQCRHEFVHVGGKPVLIHLVVPLLVLNSFHCLERRYCLVRQHAAAVVAKMFVSFLGWDEGVDVFSVTSVLRTPERELRGLVGFLFDWVLSVYWSLMDS